MDIKVPAVWTNTEFVVDGNTIWFVPYEYCFLYQYDFIKKRVCTKIFLEGAKSLWGSHYSVVKEGNYVVIVPGVNNNIYIFDKVSHAMQRIRLPEKKNVREYFRKYALWNEAIFFFPLDYPNIVKISLHNFALEEISIPKADNKYSVSVNITDLVQRGKFADLCINGSDRVLRFNMESYEGKYFSITNAQEYRTICAYEGNQILLTDKDGNAFIYDENFEKFREVVLPKNSSSYIDCAQYRNGYILVPYKKSDPIFFWSENICNVVVPAYEEHPKGYRQPWGYNDFSQVKIAGNKVLLFDVPEQSLCVIDMNTLKREYQKVAMGEIDENEKRQVYSLLNKENVVLTETDFWNLRRFIDVLKEDKNEEE